MEPKEGHSMKDLKKSFGKRLKEIREEAGFTQESLAEAVDSTRDTIRNIETGKHGPRFGLFQDIIEVLGVHPKELFEFDWSIKQRKRK